MKTSYSLDKIQAAIYQALETINISAEDKDDIVEEVTTSINENISTPVELVTEFHEAFNHPINNSVEVATADVRWLRYKLILEEFLELVNASNDGFMFADKAIPIIKDECYTVKKTKSVYDRKIEIYDAFADLKYVIAGAELVFGTHEYSERVFEEVHFSNMSKMCKDEDEVYKTIKHYNLTKNEVDVEESNTTLFVKYIVKSKDGKVLKNVNYAPADIRSIVRY